MALYSENELKLMKEIEVLKASLNFVCDMVKVIRYELSSDELTDCDDEILWDKVEAIRDYVSDISDFCR